MNSTKITKKFSRKINNLPYLPAQGDNGEYPSTLIAGASSHHAMGHAPIGQPQAQGINNANSSKTGNFFRRNNFPSGKNTISTSKDAIVKQASKPEVSPVQQQRTNHYQYFSLSSNA